MLAGVQPVGDRRPSKLPAAVIPPLAHLPGVGAESGGLEGRGGDLLGRPHVNALVGVACLAEPAGTESGVLGGAPSVRGGSVLHVLDDRSGDRGEALLTGDQPAAWV